jgi:hypothetical protein
MPSPKTETVSDKIKETVEMLKKGKISQGYLRVLYYFFNESVAEKNE